MSKAAANELSDIRSLRDLMADDEPDTTGAVIVALSLIDRDEDQPRKAFDDESIAGLAESLAVAGVIQPLIVSRHPNDAGRYMLIAGERRWRAANLAGLAEVLVIVRELSPAQRLAVQLLENADREPLNILEEATAVARLVELGNSPKQVGELLGKNKTWVSLRRKLASHISQIDVFVTGNRTQDPETLSFLIDLEALDPNAVAEFLCAEKVTRATVREALEVARAKFANAPSVQPSVPAAVTAPAELSVPDPAGGSGAMPSVEGLAPAAAPFTAREPAIVAPSMDEPPTPVEDVPATLEPLPVRQPATPPGPRDDAHRPMPAPVPAQPTASAEPKPPKVAPVDLSEEKRIKERCRAAERRIAETWNLQVTVGWSGNGEAGELRIAFTDLVDLDNLASCLGS
ncbi:ParB/RepB/Spo0J family partition protein [uncultured Thiodictyon sp.]|uniref:ParB/RepB/Spo0J family partition protein n=1 Tax=uncultured Thiodictyon sp. TaxID=1846217 RepID=UPI0025CB8BF1|nr:ParB/RepB/Spo0J family partition protein [uncultured Thiodictyon sp.]